MAGEQIISHIIIRPELKMEGQPGVTFGVASIILREQCLAKYIGHGVVVRVTIEEDVGICEKINGDENNDNESKKCKTNRGRTTRRNNNRDRAKK